MAEADAAQVKAEKAVFECDIAKRDKTDLHNRCQQLQFDQIRKEWAMKRKGLASVTRVINVLVLMQTMTADISPLSTSIPPIFFLSRSMSFGHLRPIESFLIIELNFQGR